MQESCGTPSTSTVQAPHSPPSQPRLVPVRPNCSRKYSSNRVESATASSRLRPLMLSLSRRFAIYEPGLTFGTQIAHTHRLALRARNFTWQLDADFGADADHGF